MDKLPGSVSPTALIGAYEPAPGPGGLRALVPLAGAALVEHQVRRAIAAGAGQALLIVDTVPPELAEVAARLRRDGIRLALVEDIGAAADALAADAPVLLIADACLPEAELLTRIADAAIPALATLPDTPPFAHHERIDGAHRWAGVALLDGRRVAETAAMIGGWDPVSTLLRRAVQESAHHVAAQTMPPVLMLDADRRDSVEREIVDAARRPGRDWVERFLYAPLEERLLPLLLERRIDAAWLALAAVALALLAAPLAPLGWLGAALVLLLVGGPLGAIAARIARVRDRPVPHAATLGMVREAAMAIAALGWGWSLWHATGQWGWLVVALLVPGALLLGTALRRIAHIARPPLALASPDGILWLMLPFVLIRQWQWSMASAAIYACVSAMLLLRSAMAAARAD